MDARRTIARRLRSAAAHEAAGDPASGGDASGRCRACDVFRAIALGACVSALEDDMSNICEDREILIEIRRPMVEMVSA